MAILSGDIKLLASAVMADVPEGGGGPTATVIADGVENAIFPDISELDRAGGRVSLRKTFVAVQTDDTSVYFGANVVVSTPPIDPNTSITLFARDEVFDTRATAQARVEAYLNRGPVWPGYLYEQHIAGQRVIQLFQRPGSEIPPVGHTLVLIAHEGDTNEVEQYVRAIAVSTVTRTFTTADGTEYKADIVSVSLSDALRTDFAGSPARDDFARVDTSALVRDTVVADAGTYVGCVPLSAAAVSGDATLSIGSIYTQLVPSAQTETPIASALPYSAAALPVAGAAPVTYTTSEAWSPTSALYLPGGCLPGSLTITMGSTITSDSAGLLKSAGAEIGRIDYANGLLTLHDYDMSESKTIVYTPAAQIMRTPLSTEIPVTQETRSMSYVGLLAPTPATGTLSLSYRAQGRWYVLSDDGSGALRGLDASYGAGTCSNSGQFVVTLGALPDVGSSVVVTWGAVTQETAHPAATLKAAQSIALAPPAGTTMQPGTLRLTWQDAGSTRLATASTAGVLSGHATGSVSVARATVDFTPTTLPAVGTQITAEYTAGPKHEDAFAHPSRNAAGKVPVTATVGSITPGSLEVEWGTLTDVSVLGTYTGGQLEEMGVSWVDPTQYARDDGAGNVLRDGVAIGTVNYTTGSVIFNPDAVIKIPKPKYASVNIETSNSKWGLRYTGIEYVDAPTVYPPDESGYVKLRYNTAGSTSTRTETVTFAPSVTLVPGVTAPIVPGSVVLSLAGAAPWGDSGQGVLRARTDAGWLTRGTIDYMTGRVALTSWPTGATNTLSRLGCVSTAGSPVCSEMVFRTAAAPLRPGSLTVQWAGSTGTHTATAGIDGAFSSAGVSGSVDYETGLVRVRWGQMVTAAGAENEPWYVPANVSNGMVWKPAPIVASSVRYSAVSYSYLPLDASILGLDPVRLPSDGRVTIFRPGGFVVVGHSATITATVAAGQTINCARTNLSRVRVTGSNGAVISTGYTANLAAGTVTFTSVAGYSQPVRIEHRIEDMALCRDVQMRELTLSRALTRDYPIGSTVSSALVLGDLFARVERVFDQPAWGGEWADTPADGGGLVAYNATDHPIRVTNRGAITERWVIRFTSSTSFELVGEHVGMVAVGNTGSDFAPLGPTGVPYMTVPAVGWGAGWSVGAVLRINTVAAGAPIWIVRTIQPGAAYAAADSFALAVRGDVNA
jgi:hypothetical protein